jgi:diacylglycerol O-acyltransferase
MSNPRGKLMPIADAFWTWIESPETPMQVAGLMIFKPDEPAADFVRRVVDTYRTYPATIKPFNYLVKRSRIPLMARRRVIDDVDIDYHFRHSALPAPGGQLELGILISRLHSAPLDPRRPMWEAHVIEGLEGDRVAVYLKAHHSLLDGVAGIRLLMETFSTDPDAALPPPPWARALPPRTTRTAAERRRRPKLSHIASALMAVRRLAKARRQHDNELVGLFQSPRSALNVEVSPQRRVATASLDLARIVAVGKASGTTINDVVLALCSAGLRRYLDQLDSVPAQSLTAMVPVSVRPADSDGDGNAVSMILATLATDVSDPAQRLRQIARSTEAGKNHLRSMEAGTLDIYSQAAMLPHVSRQLVPGLASARPVFNLVISNVPGPHEPLYAGGARLESWFPVSLLFKNEALNITALSYNGRLNLGFTACRTALPHVQDLALYVEHALDDLETVLSVDGPLSA